MADDITTWGIDRLTTAFRQREASPVEVLEALLDRIAADRDGTNAFSALDTEGARAAARAAEARYAAGTPLGPLDGVPVSVKDLVAMAGWTTQRGSRACADDPPATEDAPAVDRLRRAGALLFARTTTTEFGWEVGSANPLHGVTRNPRAPGRTAGGSSAGAAAQLAQGWGPLALGSDAGGSVRIPASYAGVVGFKPTWGAIPMPAVSAFAELAHLGPMARTVGDCARAFEVLSQPDLRDPHSLFARAPAAPHRRPRIGWALPTAAGLAPSPAVAQAFEQALAVWARQGFALEPVQWPGDHDTASAMWTLWCSRLYESFVGWPAPRRALLGERLQAAYETGAAQSMAALAQARVQLRDLALRVARGFEACDLWLTPATPDVAPPLDADLGHRWFDRQPYTYPFNLTQQPALVWPLGTDADGRPFGIQLVGRRFDDAHVLAIGQQLEQALQGR